MNYKFNIADPDDDAAYRARLAPLASEMLSRPSFAGTREAPRSLAGRGPRNLRLTVMAGIAAAAAALLGTWLYYEFPRPAWRDDAHAAVPADGSTQPTSDGLGIATPSEQSPPRTSLASVDSRETPGAPEFAPAILRATPPSALQSTVAPRPPNSVAPGTGDEMVGLLLRRGNTALAYGDIIGARLLYERAAALGSAVAANYAGKTYDVEFLLQAGAHGIPADPPAAIAWFRKAAALGDQDARARLARIESQGRP